MKTVSRGIRFLDTGSKFRYLPILLLLGCYVPCSTYGQDQKEIDFVVGNFEFVLLHELAHLVIGEKNVPVLGSPESAADYIAAVIMTRDVGDDPKSTDTLRRFSRSAATAFATSWRLGNESNADIPYWDNHALGIQRYYSILCLLYGSNPEAQAAIPYIFGLPKQRAVGCAAEFESANRGVQWLLDNFSDTAIEPAGKVVTYSYDRSRSRQLESVIDEIKRLGLLEKTVGAFVDHFSISKPFAASIRSCGRAEAAWQPQSRELVVCFELLDVFLRIYQEEI